MWTSIRNLLFQILIVLIIGVAAQWVIGIDWRLTTLILTVLVIINWATRLPGDRCVDIMNSFRDLGRFAVTLAIFAVLRILFWSAFGFSMIESFSAGHGVGPRGAMNLVTPAPVRETIIWELLLDGALLALGYWLAVTSIKKTSGGQTNVQP